MAGKTLQSTIEIAGSLSPSLQQAIKQAVDRLEEMSQETLESAGAAAKLAAEISTQESVLKNLQRGYEDYIVSGSESTDEALKLASTIQDLSGELNENRDALETAHQAAQKLTVGQGETADAYSRLQKQIGEQEAELETLRRSYANVVLIQGEASTEARQLASQISQLSGDLNENRQRLSAADQAADQLGNTLEDAGQDAENSSEGYTVLKNVLANLVTEGINKAVDVFKELATEGDTSLAMLEAKTGAASSEMEGFKDVMYEVYNSNYGDSLGDVSDKLSTVIQMTDNLDKASLAQITKNAIALEDVFGFDVVESLRAANSLTDQFGISAEGAFNLIVQGAQKGLNQNGDLLDTINEYSVQFRNAGYSADDMFNMLANGAETGTWSIDKLGDAVKEFNIRMSDGTANEYLDQLGLNTEEVIAQFNKGGPEAQAAIGDIMEALQECDDATLQYQAGVGLFGTMWEDLGVDTVASLMDTQGAIQSTSDAMTQLERSAYDTLESSLSQLGRTIKSEVVEPIAEKLTPAMKNAINFVNSNVGPAIDWLLSHLPEVGIAISAIGSIIVAMQWGSFVSKLAQAKGAITGLMAAIGGISAPVLAVIAIVTALAAAFMHLWKTNEEFRANITGIWNNIKSKFDEFGKGIVDRLNELGFDFKNFGEVVSSIWDGFCNLLAPVFEGVFRQVSNILSASLDLLLNLFDIFKGIFTGDWDAAWQGVKNVFSTIWEFITNTFQNWGNTFTSIVNTVLGWIGSNWDNAWEGIKTAASNAVNAIPGLLSSGWEALKSGISTVGSALGPLLDSGWNALKNAATTAVNNLPSALSSGWEALKSGISTVGGALGPLLDSGWNALKNAASTILGQMPNTVSEKLEAVKSTISNIGDGLGGLLDAGWETLKNAAENAASAVKKAWEGVKNFFSGIWDAITGGGGETATPAVDTSAIQNTEISIPLDSASIEAANNAIKNLGESIMSAQQNATTFGNLITTVSTKIQTDLQSLKAAFSSSMTEIRTIVTSVWTSLNSLTKTAWDSIKNVINSKMTEIQNSISSILNAMRANMSSNLQGALSTVNTVFSSILSTVTNKMQTAANAVHSAIASMRSAFNFTWSLPHLAVPHVNISGGFSLDPPSAPNFSVSWYSKGGILTKPTLFGLAGGEAGDEAVVPLKVLWNKLDAMIHETFNAANTVGETPDSNLVGTAGKLLALDNFSLGSLANNTSTVIYYDFSGFTWSPQIQVNESGENDDDFMARLKAHEAEFFDWLEEFIQAREVALYA